MPRRLKAQYIIFFSDTTSSWFESARYRLAELIVSLRLIESHEWLHEKHSDTNTELDTIFSLQEKLYITRLNVSISVLILFKF